MDLANRARTKAAREAAGAACEDLILRLWERRTDWPQGWPPPAAARVLQRLSLPADEPDGFRFYRPQVVDKGARTWTDTFPVIADLQRTELEIWRDALLREVDTAKLNDWIENYGANMEATEREALERIVSAAKLAHQRLGRDASSGSRHSGSDPVDPRSQLDAIQQRRAAIIRRVAQKKKRPAVTRRDQ